MKAKVWIWISIAVAIVGIGIGLFFFFRGKNDKAIYWKEAKITRGKVAIKISATGTLSADTTVLVGTQVSGTILKIDVDFNSKVKKGQIICELDKTPLLAALVDAQANVKRTQALFDEASREYNRNKDLLAQKVLSQSDFDLSLANYETAEANLQSAKAQANKAQINLDYATIRAPISGIVVQRNVDVGQTVAASFSTPTLFSIANDLTKMQVQANVDEADIGQVQVGQKVNFTVQAYRDETFRGTVQQIRLQPTIISNVVNYTVIIDVPNKDQKLLPGMTATINVTVQEHDSVLKVPNAALKFTPSADYFKAMGLPAPVAVSTPANSSTESGARHRKTDAAQQQTTDTLWVIKADGTLDPRPVTLGLATNTETEVAGNITENDTVAEGQLKAADAAQQTRSPFMPTMPSKKSGGSPRKGL